MRKMRYLTVLALFTLIAPALADEPAPATEPGSVPNIAPVETRAAPSVAPSPYSEAAPPAKDPAGAAAFDVKFRAQSAKLAAALKDLAAARGRNQILEGELDLERDRSKQLSDDRLNDRQALARTSAQKDNAVADAEHMSDLNERLMKKLDASSSDANSLGTLLFLVSSMVFIVGLIGLKVWRRTTKILARLPDDETELMVRRLREQLGRVSEEAASARLRFDADLADANHKYAEARCEIDGMSADALVKVQKIAELSTEVGLLREENAALLRDNTDLRLLKTPAVAESLDGTETPGPEALARRHDQASGSDSGLERPLSPDAVPELRSVEIDLGLTPPPVTMPLPEESAPRPADPMEDTTRKVETGASRLPPSKGLLMTE